MPFEYEYTRHIRPDGRYDIDNPDRVDGEGNQILLAKEIHETFPDLLIKTQCVELVFKVITEIELDSTQQATLTQVVLDHQANA